MYASKDEGEALAQIFLDRGDTVQNGSELQLNQ